METSGSSPRPNTGSSPSSQITGTIARQVFLGAARDYTISLNDKTELRVTAPPDQNIAPGQPVWLRLPVERCRALERGDEA
mgnify:CR=1 FL=1